MEIGNVTMGDILKLHCNVGEVDNIEAVSCDGLIYFQIINYENNKETDCAVGLTVEQTKKMIDFLTEEINKI